MGQNKRYGTDVSDSALNDFLTRPRPISLSREELGNLPVTQCDDDSEVLAWVRYPETPVEVRGRVVEFTDRAARVAWRNRDGSAHSAWVWRDALSTPPTFRR